MQKNNQDGEEQDIEKNNNINNFDEEDDENDNDNDDDTNHMSQYFVYDSQKKKKGKLTQQEIEQEIQRYLNSKIPYEKETLCRFYLRGCCRFTKEECKYAHDLNDLKNFQKLSQMEREIDFKYKIKDYDQRPLLDTLRVQYSLVDYQKKLLKLGKLDKEYSIEELTLNKKDRVKVRDLMHKNMYIEFYYKLLEIYKDDNFFFTDNFLIGEYNRVGFNKIGNQVSYKYITQFLCNQVAYDVQIMLPPFIQPKFKTNCIRQLPKSEEMYENFESKVFEAIINQGELKGYPVQEADIKKVFYKDNISLDMPLHTFLTLKKISFTKFISEILDQDKFTKIIEEQENYKKALSQNQNLSVKNAVIFDFDKEKCVQILSSILAEFQKSNKILVDLKILENKIINEIQTQQNLIQKVKDFIRHFLIQKKHYIIFNPVSNYLVISQKGKKTKKDKDIQQVINCSCNYPKIENSFIQQKQQQYQNQENKNIQNNQNSFLKQRVILVDDLKSLEYAYFILVQNIDQFLLKKEMGVDLEGSLRFGGRIDLVQISVQFKEEARIQIFVFDALTLGQEKLLYDKFRFILQETIGNEKILKIFHDCRKDSLALHFNTGICVKNVFDTAAVHMFREEIEGYFTAHLQKDTFNLMRYLEFTIKWPGLNDILETYQASHGINQQKDDMHRKFSDQRYAEYFRSRPIKDDYLEYSARDVEDLIEVKQNMMNCIKELGVKEKMQMDNQILEYVVLQMSQDYAKDCLLEFKQKIIEKFCNNQEFVFDNTLQYILMEQQNNNKL
ncbi:Ribonuclease H-like domain [Pseudocohnilembus persalinus]|uniref:Ribonuclease H-like domain n=1 Tax=Pseudocohnilembus persalinus TaxID=266149 RepID=A0A0V0QH73_PSEPJ|nr:Ribonuclease H-like domain [Pseudocohnilembus persalinus]|eukprot:KRX01440.1 Ribonuclease H-like domain [Pseudocohnilembus persalinus]